MNPEEPQNPTTAPDANQPIQPVQPVGQSMDFVQPPPETPAPAEQPIQMPPYAPSQPPVTAEVPTVSPVMPAPDTQSAHHKKDGMGILSIVFGLIGAFPIGLILGLVGASKAKKAQRSAVLSRIGWILNVVVMLAAAGVAVLLVMKSMEASEVKARDTERAKDLNAIEAKLEEYFEDNFGYPNDLDKLDFTDEQVLIGPNGSTIKVNEVAVDEDEAKDSTNPTSKVEYTYTPYGKPACLTTCDGYVLKALIEKPTTGVSNPLVKLGLENL